jgi:hypothetical protein
MSKTYRSDALTAIHEAASDLRDAGVMDERTLREFGELCRTPARPMSATDIRALRTRERVRPIRLRAASECHPPASSASGNEARSTEPAPRSSC